MNLRKLNHELTFILESMLNKDKLKLIKKLATSETEKQTINLYKINDKFVVLWSSDAERYPDTSVEIELCDNEDDALEQFFYSDYVRNVYDYNEFVDGDYIKISDRKFKRLGKEILGYEDDDEDW